MQVYQRLLEPTSGEVIEKKSRFIADVIPVQTEEEALTFIAQTKKKYWDARHHCYAYIIGKGDIKRCSDDGEPSKTAGMPMMDILENKHIYNICVVVTRYFGGVLLGTGGLIRAYQGALLVALEHAKLARSLEGEKLYIQSNYELYGKLEFLINTCGLYIFDTSYSDRVDLTVLVGEEDVGNFIKKVTDMTSGKVMIEREKKTLLDINGKFFLA